MGKPFYFTIPTFYFMFFIIFLNIFFLKILINDSTTHDQSMYKQFTSVPLTNATYIWRII